MSFSAFLGEYVKRCVGEYPRVSTRDDDAHTPSARVTNSVGGAPKASAVNTSSVTNARARTTAKKTVEPARGLPKTLAHVQSKLKPELDARREKLLRVKKTQSQLMKESLTRTRLAEYEAKRMLDVAGSRQGRSALSRKPPLADITTGVSVCLCLWPLGLASEWDGDSDVRCITDTVGAAALEIADGFMTSPLLDSFGGKENDDGDTHSTTRVRNDPLREELYGTTALDDSYLGCKTPSSSHREQRTTTATTTKPSRRYNGWLGDFGPQHTKTVVTEWGTPDDDDSDTESKQNRPQVSRQGAVRSLLSACMAASHGVCVQRRPGTLRLTV